MRNDRGSWQQETRGGGTLTIEGSVIVPYPADATAAVVEWAGLPRPGYDEQYVMSIGTRLLWRESLCRWRRMARLEYRIVLYRKRGES